MKITLRLGPALLLLISQLPVANAASPTPSSDAWILWGGPTRNFVSSAQGLAVNWPEAGPPVLWKRDLGEGYSGIAVEGGVLYTMYYRTQPYWYLFTEQQEIVIAMDARTGKTLWEFPYTIRYKPGYGGASPGPTIMPQIVGDRLFTVGVTGKLHALNKKTGELIWQHDLYEDYGGTYLQFGYSSHPLPYKDNLIAMVGGEGKAMISFKQSNGEIVWAKHSFTNAHSAPILIDVDGHPEIAAVTANRIIGVDPETGEMLWSAPHNTEYGLAVSMPVWGEDNLLFYSSSYGNGSRVLRLTRDGAKTRAEELWHNQRVRVHFGSIVRIGNTAYASSGHDGPAPMTAVDVPSGKILWQTRGFAKASFILAEGKIFVIDEEGNLGLATLSPEGLQIISKVPLLTSNAWTVPTLVGTTLYARDRKQIMAVDVGAH